MADAPSSALPAVGETAPDFTLPSSAGGEVTLSQLRGKPVVLYFYPKDDTSGCTTEACAFRDLWGELQANGVTVLGVSRDPLKAHAKFASKYALPFPLLSDEGGAVTQRYGVWVEKSMYGRKYMGIARTTFYIRPDGTIGHVWPKVKPQGHAAEVLAVVSAEA